MKSNLFLTATLKNQEDIVSDFGELLNLSKSQIDKIPDYANLALVSPSEIEEISIQKKAASALKIPRLKINKILDISQFFLREFTSMGDATSDDPNTILNDISSMMKIPKEKRETLIDYFNKIKRIAIKKSEIIILKRFYTRSSLPNLKSMETTINFRAIFDKTYKFINEVKSYNPKCLGTIPLGIIQISLDTKPNTEIYFQVDERTLEIMKKEIEVMEKQIKIARSHLNLVEEKNK